jgi:hypothetical protein
LLPTFTTAEASFQQVFQEWWSDPIKNAMNINGLFGSIGFLRQSGVLKVSCVLVARSAMPLCRERSPPFPSYVCCTLISFRWTFAIRKPPCRYTSHVWRCPITCASSNCHRRHQ